MTRPSSSNDSGHARRVVVTLLITTAAAAVTAGVALQKRPHAEAVVQPTVASPAPAGGMTATGVPVVTRREQWRDPWKGPAPLSESAATSIPGSPDGAMSSSDPSLPAAADALQRSSETSDEPALTF